MSRYTIAGSFEATSIDDAIRRLAEHFTSLAANHIFDATNHLGRDYSLRIEPADGWDDTDA